MGPPHLNPLPQGERKTMEISIKLHRLRKETFQYLILEICSIGYFHSIPPVCDKITNNKNTAINKI